ncbi:MAG: PHP domain-containing protein, partial [Myxococcales bacterium]|nr:PHP domain-containing protein [Myxococcales bacterium]
MVAELLTRTCFSLLDGASQPHELVQAALAGGVGHLGICDRDGVYGLVQAHQAAQESGLHLICGATLTLDGLPSVVVHCVDRSGWASLCHLLTLGRAEQTKGWSKLSLAAICEHHRGLMCTLRPGWEPSEAAPLREAYGERLSVALSRDLTPADPHRTAAAQAL